MNGTSQGNWRRRVAALLGARRRDRIRDAAIRVLDLASRRVLSGAPHVVRLDYPPSAHPGPRYGHGRRQHAALAEVIAAHHDAYRAELTAVKPLADDLLRIPVSEVSPGEPCWVNPWLEPLDTALLYGYVRRLAPSRYVEIGSGYSTAVARRAQKDGELSTRITSIDPTPRREVDPLCDEMIREPLETTDLDLLLSLAAGDVVFFDGSHRVFTNSDVVTFYLDVLPNLAEGVVVGIHDIMWPDDYLQQWTNYWFSEQYLLGAYLIAGAPFIEPLLACHYVSQDPRLRKILGPLWDELGLPDVSRRGFTFWLRAGRARAARG